MDKVTYFMQNVFKTVIPYSATLAHQNVVSSSSFHVCGTGFESVNHATWRCVAAKEVWKLSELTNYYKKFRQGEFFEFVLLCFGCCK